MSAGLDAGIGQRLLARLERALDQIVDQPLEIGAGDRLDEMLRAVLVGGDEGQVDLGRRGRADSSIFAFSAASFRRCSASLSLVRSMPSSFLKSSARNCDELGVEILAAEEGVAVGRLHLEHAVADLEDRDVERAAAKVIDRDRLAVLLVEAIGQRGRGRLVDDAQHFEAGDLAGVLGRLALGVVEIGRNGDDRLRHRLAEIGSRRFPSSSAA